MYQSLTASFPCTASEAADVLQHLTLEHVASTVSKMKPQPSQIYYERLCGLPMEQLKDVYLSCYEVQRVYSAAELLPSARSVLPTLPTAVVYDVAVQRGISVRGIAPAHTRRGKFLHPTPDNTPRVYCGPKTTYQAGSIYSM